MDEIKLSGAEISPFDKLDLTSHGVLGHFAKSSHNVQLLNFLMALDRVDRWAVDYAEDTSAQPFELQLLMQEVQAFVETYALVLHRVPQPFAELLAQLTSSRCMYLVQYLAQRNEAFTGSLGALLGDAAVQSADLSVLRSRLDVFSKAHLLSEVFSGQRLREISQIMESYADA